MSGKSRAAVVSSRTKTKYPAASPLGLPCPLNLEGIGVYAPFRSVLNKRQAQLRSNISLLCECAYCFYLIGRHFHALARQGLSYKIKNF